jgi:ribose transport system permease protein
VSTGGVLEPRVNRSRELRETLHGWTEGVGRFAAVLILTVALWIFFAATQARFVSGANQKNMLTGVSILWVVSMGMTFVVLTAGIDLSVGSVLALTGIFLSEMLNDFGLPGWIGLILALIFGAIVGGSVNGFLIGPVGLSFFVVTLGSMQALRGAVDLWSHTHTTYIDDQLVNSIGLGNILSIPVPIWIMVVTFALGFYVLRSTYFGRDIYAVGGNIEAARLSGISVSRTLIAVYAIAGASAALGGVIECGRIGAASPLVGTDIPLNAAAAVLLGGTSFIGGAGGVVGTAIGVLFIAVLQNGLGIAGVASFWQEVVTGVILIAAVMIDRMRTTGFRFRKRGASQVERPPENPLEPAS